MNYKTKLTLLGLPLVHIATSGMVNGRPKRSIAKGWIAIGDISFGIIFSAGAVASGGIAIGVLSFAGLAIGVFAVGGLPSVFLLRAVLVLHGTPLMAVLQWRMNLRAGEKQSPITQTIWLLKII